MDPDELYDSVVDDAMLYGRTTQEQMNILLQQAVQWEQEAQRRGMTFEEYRKYRISQLLRRTWRRTANDPS